MSQSLQSSPTVLKDIPLKDIPLPSPRSRASGARGPIGASARQRAGLAARIGSARSLFLRLVARNAMGSTWRPELATPEIARRSAGRVGAHGQLAPRHVEQVLKQGPEVSMGRHTRVGTAMRATRHLRHRWRRATTRALVRRTASGTNGRSGLRARELAAGA